MRIALGLLISSAVFAAEPFVSGSPNETLARHERMLDTSSRARPNGSWYTVPVTEVQFRKMQQQYRAHDFNMWMHRLRQLRPGMTEKQVLAVLRPKEVGFQLAKNPILIDTIVLNDAYFADIWFSAWPHRMISTTPPMAITYDIKPVQKSRPRPNHTMQPTARRRTASLLMTNNLLFQASLAPASGG